MLENTEGQSKMDNPEKLAKYGTQDEYNQSKNTTQYVLDTTIGKQTQITYIRHQPPYYKQLVLQEISRYTCLYSFLVGNLSCLKHKEGLKPIVEYIFILQNLSEQKNIFAL